MFWIKKKKYWIVIKKKKQWRHNDHDGVSNHQPHGCLLNRVFRRRSKKTSKLGVTGLCVGNSPGPVNSSHKGPVTRKMFPFDDVIMGTWLSFACCKQLFNCWKHTKMDNSYMVNNIKCLIKVAAIFRPYLTDKEVKMYGCARSTVATNAISSVPTVLTKYTLFQFNFIQKY